MDMHEYDCRHLIGLVIDTNFPRLLQCLPVFSVPFLTNQEGVIYDHITIHQPSGHYRGSCLQSFWTFLSIKYYSSSIHVYSL